MARTRRVTGICSSLDDTCICAHITRIYAHVNCRRRTQSAHPPAAARRHPADIAADGVAERPGHAGTGVHGTDRDLVRVATRHACAGRDGGGFPRIHDDADALGGRDGWRHFLRHCARDRRRPSRRCGRARAAWRHRQRRARHGVRRALSRIRRDAVSRDGSGWRGARGRSRLFEYRVRGDGTGVADECGGQRDPRHRQHARALAWRVLRDCAVDSPFPVSHLRVGTDSRAGHRRRGDRGRPHDDAYSGRTRLVCGVRAKPAAVQMVTPEARAVRRYPACRRGRLDQHIADQPDRGTHDRTGGCGGRGQRGGRLRHCGAIGIPAGSPRVRPWRASRCARRYQHRRRIRGRARCASHSSAARLRLR